MYLNGWIAIFQLLASFPLLIPSAPASNLAIRDIPENLWYEPARDSALAPRCHLLTLDDNRAGTACAALLASIRSLLARMTTSTVSWLACAHSHSECCADCSMAPVYISLYLVFNVGECEQHSLTTTL